MSTRDGYRLNLAPFKPFQGCEWNIRLRDTTWDPSSSEMTLSLRFVFLCVSIWRNFHKTGEQTVLGTARVLEAPVGGWRLAAVGGWRLVVPWSGP